MAVGYIKKQFVNYTETNKYKREGVRERDENSIGVCEWGVSCY